MSLYNMMCVMNPATGRLLRAIALDPKDIPRPRDAWVDRDLTVVTVFTRTGGGNRPDHEAENTALQSRPDFIGDNDWSRDETYAEFRFRLPADQKAAILEEIAELEEDHRSLLMDAITEPADVKFGKALIALEAAVPKKS
jgi:hypothetical protein